MRFLVIASQAVPAVIVLALVLARASNQALRERISWTTVGLMAAWALLMVIPGQFGLPSHVLLFVGYVALASLIVNGVAVLGYVVRKLTDATVDAPPWYTRVVRLLSVIGIAVILFIATVHHI